MVREPNVNFLIAGRYRFKDLEAVSYTLNSITVNGPFLENVVLPFPVDISSTVASLNLYELQILTRQLMSKVPAIFSRQKMNEIMRLGGCGASKNQVLRLVREDSIGFTRYLLCLQ